MKIRVDLELQKAEFPLDYRPAVVSLIKALLSKHYQAEYDSFYSGTTSKDFTFAVDLPKPSFKSDLILLSERRITLNISVGNEHDGIVLYNAFQKSTSYVHNLPNANTLTIKKVAISAQQPIKSSSVVIRFISPLVVRKHTQDEKDRYYIFDDKEFSATLQAIVDKQLGHEALFKLEPINAKYTVVLSFGTKIRSSIGTYRLSASSDVLNTLSNSGMGSRRNMGFGYFTVLKEG